MYELSVSSVEDLITLITVAAERIRDMPEIFHAASLSGENVSQVAEILNGVYGADTVTANYMQFWFRRFRSGIFDVKGAPRTGKFVIENVDKITKIINDDRHVNSRSHSQEIKF
ncbi:histone-lysine N-methyltransferase SETMAR [Trichonephila clavipes]|nr:histone-lysine N-methyltransferase SETMAR [Trichonephila clavipes]